MPVHPDIPTQAMSAAGSSRSRPRSAHVPVAEAAGGVRGRHGRLPRGHRDPRGAGGCRHARCRRARASRSRRRPGRTSRRSSAPTPSRTTRTSRSSPPAASWPSTRHRQHPAGRCPAPRRSCSAWPAAWSARWRSSRSSCSAPGSRTCSGRRRRSWPARARPRRPRRAPGSGRSDRWLPGRTPGMSCSARVPRALRVTLATGVHGRAVHRAARRPARAPRHVRR